MNPVTSPLTPQSRGAVVADLQDALRECLDRRVLYANNPAARQELADRLRKERTEQVYGEATRKLASVFQRERDISPHDGLVNPATAAALNALLREWGLLDAGPPPDRQPAAVISGRVTREDELPLAGVRVRAFHDDGRVTVRLGDDATDDDGRYTVRYDPLPGVEAVQLRVTAVGDDGRTLASVRPDRPAGPLEVVNLTIPVTAVVPARNRIEGRVVLEHGAPAEKMHLRLYRRGFGGGEEVLAETTTVGQGRYAFDYPAGSGGLSLEVRAVVGKRETALSKPLHDLGHTPRTVLNLAAPRTAQPLAAEYRRLRTDLTPHVGGMAKLAAAKETAGRQDLTVLNRATGWDARLIALAVTAERLHADPDVGLPQEAVYGLLRAGLPSDKRMLARVGVKAATAALVKVRDAGAVALSDGDVTAFEKQYTAFARKLRLAEPLPGGRATYADVLDKSGLSDADRNAFADVFLAHRGDAAGLWKAADAARLPPAAVIKLQRQGKLSFLAGHSGPLTARLSEKSIKGPAELVAGDFDLADTWKAEVFDLAGVPVERRDALTDDDRAKLDAVIPDTFAGGTTEARLTAYAADLSRKVRRSYPTQVVARTLARDPADTFALGTARGPTQAVLTKAIGHGFRFGDTPAGKFLADNPGVKDGLSADDARAAERGMRTLQRVYQISPSAESMTVLGKLGLTAAYDVTAYTEDEFVRLFDDKYRDLLGRKPVPGLAKTVYRKAAQVGAVSYTLFTAAKKLDADPPMSVTSPGPEVREQVKTDLIKQYPTLESLFGSTDYCECEHCRSVLSPAAYLVDLLQFIDPTADDQSKVWDEFKSRWETEHGGAAYPHTNAAGDPVTPYEVLIERRPDLPHLPLTCENTHIVLPYIDVVNEILEYHVANGKLDDTAARDTGGADSADLLAEPQNVITAAYDALRDAVYPLALPFDLWLETVRQFCAHYETPLPRVLEAFRPADDLFATAQPFDRAAVFLESLGLSAAEVALFTRPDPLADDWWHTLYGLPTGRPAIENPTNTEHATLTLPDPDADGFRPGVVCTYQTAGGALAAESMTISAVGPPGSGNNGHTLVTFDGTWGTPPAAGERLVCDAAATLGSAKTLSRTLGLTYKEMVEVVQAGFVNPQLVTLGVLYKLNVSIHDARTYLDTLADPSNASPKQQLETTAFKDRLEALAVEFGTTLADLEAKLAAIPFGGVLVLHDPNAGCDFSKTRLQYADETPVDAAALLRVNLLVRLWQKLGWTLEETDRALQVLTPKDTPFEPAHFAKRPLLTALIHLAHLKELSETLAVGKHARLKLPALWADLATTGRHPLYAQLFLTPTVLKADPVFDATLGDYLSDAAVKAAAARTWHWAQAENVAEADQLDPTAFADRTDVKVEYDRLQMVQRLGFLGVPTDADKADLAARVPGSAVLPTLLDAVQTTAKEFSLVKGHRLALQGALGLSAGEIDAILTDRTLTPDTPLTLPTVSMLYRYGLLAKGLKLSVREVIALRRLSGIDPFAPLAAVPLTDLAADVPFSNTLRFVRIAGEVKESGLTVDDLDYLLAHRFDPTGRYRPDPDADLAALKSLADGIRAIRAEHAVPTDPAALTEDGLRQKLGLVLDPAVVERLFAMLAGTAEFTAAEPATDAQKLNPQAFAGEPAVREVRHVGATGTQQLTYRGVLFDAEKAQLNARLPRPPVTDPPTPHTPSPLLATLLDGVQKQARNFFDAHLLRQAGPPASGFLADANYATLFDQSLAPVDPKARQKWDEGRRMTLATAFLPALQQRLVRQLVVRAITARTGADPTLVESLLADPRLLGDPSLLTSFAASAARGVSASFFASADGTGAPLAAPPVLPTADTAAANLAPPANSAAFTGYLEVPTTGAYRFHVVLGKKDATAELWFDHRPEPLFWTGTAAKDDDELGGQPDQYLELKTGVLYPFRLNVRQLNGGRARLLVQGETMPKGEVSQLPLTPRVEADGALLATVLLAKVLQLVQALALTEREVRYLTTHADDFGGLNLGGLPADRVGDTPAERTATAGRFSQFRRLAAYAKLKREMAGGTDDLITVFEAAGAKDETKVYDTLAALTRRPAETVRAAARAVFATPEFASDEPLGRVWEVLRVVERFGVPVGAVAAWTDIVRPSATPGRRFATARGLKEAIKARLDADGWRRVAQPIFDRLRRRQRDALVAFTLRRLGFARTEQLYEYFLLDPGMEPVVQTSRVRLAIASVQLFVQRCLLNLEPRVHPSAIPHAGRWAWMKRYRVWEANRKIFLFPENWLEPEFRDDKTHLFAELEGTLLQGDVSADLVEDAFLVYLRKLEELARLEVAAMHIQDDDTGRRLHVIGRTYAEPHKHFYRRYANGAWTPWEPVAADIEGDHLAPVVWRDRLYLFWVTFLEKPRPGTLPKIDPAKKPVEVSPAETDLEAHLHWSEYAHGEWTSRESGGADPPEDRAMRAATSDGVSWDKTIVSRGASDFEKVQGKLSLATASSARTRAVDPRQVRVHVSVERFDDGSEGGVFIHLSAPFSRSFYLAGRNSSPTLGGYADVPAHPYTPAFNANQLNTPGFRGSGAFQVSFAPVVVTTGGTTSAAPVTTPILTKGGAFGLAACNNDPHTLGVPPEAYENAANPTAVRKAVEDGIKAVTALTKPVFYQDDLYTLFVEPDVTERTVEQWEDWLPPPPRRRCSNCPTTTW